MTRLLVMILITKVIYIKTMPPDIKLLQDLGYRVKQFTPYHFHVYYNDTHLNIWISSNGKKYMPEVPRPATEYTDVQEIISIIENKNTAKEEHATALNDILSRIHKV